MITRPTPKFCNYDLKSNPVETLARIAGDIERILPDGFKVIYLNQVNVDPDSPDYNPDGMVGRFMVSIPEPEFDSL